MTTKSRLISKLIDGTGQVKASLLDSDGISVSSQKSVTAASGTTTYSSADTLPATATSGDQAFVTSTNRLYIYSGSGWYNIALVNNTPYWSTEAASSYDLNTTGTATTITILAVDSDGTQPVYTATADSDFNQIATLSRDSDNGRIFTITPTDSENGTAVTGTGTITFKASDGISLVSTLSTFNLTFITSVDNSKYTTLLSKADTAGTDNQVDASSNTHTITEAGDVTSTAFTPYHPGGYSVAFAGSDDYLGFDNGYIATNGSWWNSSGFTLELWFYKTVSTGTTGTVFDNRQSSSSGFLLSNKNTGWDMYLNGAYLFQDVGTEKVGQWVHLALVASGTTVTLYEDGTSIYTIGSAPNTSSYAYYGRSQNTVGAVQYTPRGTNIDWPGYMYDIRISSGSRYTTAFTPSETPHENDSDTILLACSSPMLKDKSSNNHEITVFGNGISTARFTPHDYESYTKADHGGSVYFDGTGDNLSMASSADFNFGSEDWTIEAWLYQTARDASNVCRWYMSGANGDGNAIHVSINTNGTLDCGRATGGGVITGSSTAVMPLNTWNHVVATKEGSNGYLYLNGKQVSTSGSATEQTSGNISLRIGYDIVNTVNEQFTGYISDLRIVKGTAVYTSAFTPPTAPLTAITNTKLLTCTNKNDIWEQADGKPFTKVSGGPTVSNTQRKFTTSSALNFADTDNTYLLKDLGETIGTRDFTVEAWVYPTTTSAQHVFQISNQSVGYQSITTQNTQVGIGMNNGFWRYGTTGWNFGYIHTTTAVVVNTWHHVAYVRTGGNSKLYLNGTEIHSNADTANYSARYLAYGVGHQSNNVWSGYTQGLRIAIGYARYTSNFTPPTEEFAG